MVISQPSKHIISQLLMTDGKGPYNEDSKILAFTCEQINFKSESVIN